MRLDQLIFARGLTDSREKAQRLVRDGFVSVDGKVVTKPSTAVADDIGIEIAENDNFVGRGAYKLQGALDAFGIDLTNRVCLDIGASTGGFTEVMLRRGARYVYAVDVGSGQLAERLRTDERVCNMEKTDVRTLTKDRLPLAPDFCSIDVSFISLHHVLPCLKELNNGQFVALIKPQFEAGRADIGKNGIVKSPAAHERVLKNFCSLLASLHLSLSALIASPVRGGDGNIEYLAAFSHVPADYTPDFRAIVRAAFAAKS
ncbi:MAG: TlyA family RNA methyltransferase [Clostridia bacterium]|nr:TlyA family RNA methyltransferase [Clostridia bacterium]